LRKPFLNNSPPSSLKPSFLTHDDPNTTTTSQHDLPLKMSSVTLLVGSSSNFLVKGKSSYIYIFFYLHITNICNLICLYCSWTPNHYTSDAIRHCIRSQFRGTYDYYDAMIEDDKLKWWTDFKVILIFNYNFIQINQNGKTETKCFLVFNIVESLRHLRTSDILKRSTSPKSKNDFVSC